MILRYPGGKKRKAAELAQALVPCTELREPFFGSGAVTFAALAHPRSPKRVWINDKDRSIAALFTSILREPSKLVGLIEGFKPSVEAFRDFKASLLDPTNTMADVERGFQKLAVHQMSFSGLGTKAGSPIGGWNPDTVSSPKKYDVGCRWNRDTLVATTGKLHHLLVGRVHEDRCTTYDACEVIAAPGEDVTIYADPPYVEAGAELYEESFTESDHCRLAEALRACPHRWMLSYDDHPLVRDLYATEKVDKASWAYTINSQRDNLGAELLILRGVDNPFTGILDLLNEWYSL